MKAKLIINNLIKKLIVFISHISIWFILFWIFTYPLRNIPIHIKDYDNIVDWYYLFSTILVWMSTISIHYLLRSNIWDSVLIFIFSIIIYFFIPNEWIVIPPDLINVERVTHHIIEFLLIILGSFIYTSPIFIAFLLRRYITINIQINWKQKNKDVV